MHLLSTMLSLSLILVLGALSGFRLTSAGENEGLVSGKQAMKTIIENAIATMKRSADGGIAIHDILGSKKRKKRDIDLKAGIITVDEAEIKRRKKRGSDDEEGIITHDILGTKKRKRRNSDVKKGEDVIENDFLVKNSSTHEGIATHDILGTKKRKRRGGDVKEAIVTTGGVLKKRKRRDDKAKHPE